MLSQILCSIFEFNPDRIKSPAVIVGIIIMAIGLVTVLASNQLVDKFCKDEQKKDNTVFIARIIGIIVVVAGSLIAILMS